MTLPEIAQGLNLAIDPFCVYAHWGVEVYSGKCTPKAGVINAPLGAASTLTDGIG